MKKVEEDKLVAFTIVSIIFAIGIMILMHLIVMGFTSTSPKLTLYFVNTIGPVLIFLGVLITVFYYFKKRSIILKYAIVLIVIGVIMLLLKYCFYQTVYGYHVYYSLLGLIGLYIVGVIGYTIYRIRNT